MSAILAIVTALVLIIIGTRRETKSARERTPALVNRYLHPAHTWLRVTEDGDVLVGVDGFTQSVIGTVDAVTLPRLLRKVHQGKVVVTLHHGSRSVDLVSPVTGRVIEKNESVVHHPSLVNASPYAEGWLFRVRPGTLQSQLQNLLSGRRMQQWQDLARTQLAQMFSASPALMYQDGGVPVENLAERCSDEEWHAVTQQFFLSDQNVDTHQ